MENEFAHLKTPYPVAPLPYPEHPRPQFCREHFLNLNGLWALSVQKGADAAELGSILVPFPPESDASGIGRVTQPGETLIYQRSFSLTPEGKTVLLHFGAVDCMTEIAVNGKLVGVHKGGYLPFTLDITACVRSGENRLTVYVQDDLDPDEPYGKQRSRRGGMWYTPVSGIWQTVWLECVPRNYIQSLRISVTTQSVTVQTQGGEEEKALTIDGEKTVSYRGDTVTVALEQPRLWTPETPELYRFTLKSGEDTVCSYFALREISTDIVNGKSRLLLNGKPYFFHGLLDQGYFSDGIFLPGSPEGYRQDILKMKELGFNMLRKHIKIEPEIFYYYCDVYGMAVFQDMVNSGSYSFLLDTALPTVGLRASLPRYVSESRREIFRKRAEETVSCLYNHPCVVYYTIFNEGWGQHDSAKLYRLLKAADPSRIWDTASGWFFCKETDVQSEHVYFRRIKLRSRLSLPMVLSEFGGYVCKIPEHSFNPRKTYGYKLCADPEALTADLEALYQNEILPAISEGLCACVLTQLSDVEDETNGMMTYDRQVLKPDPDRMRRIARRLQEAFARSCAEPR